MRRNNIIRDESITLGYFTSAKFLDVVGICTSPRIVRQAMLKRPEIESLRHQFAQRTITESDLGRFLDQLYQDFERGKQFGHEIALAAIAVAIEKIAFEFAETYLLDLARLKIVEMSLAPKVAGECLKHRMSLPRVSENTRNFLPVNRISRRYQAEVQRTKSKMLSAISTFSFRKAQACPD